MFCIKCGQQLPDGSKFCSNCGTSLDTVSTREKSSFETITLNNKQSFVPAMCPNCSSHMRVDSSTKIARCESCGTECLVQDAIKALNVNGSVHVGNATINVGGININSLLKRAELMLSDGDFVGARQKCDTILDAEPTNGYAYLFMLMCDLNCRTRTELANQPPYSFNNNNYNKALLFGDDALKNELQNYVSVSTRNKAQNELRIQRAKQIQHQLEAQKAALQKTKKGDDLIWGTYNGQHIEWRVLLRNENKILILSYSICQMPFHQESGKVTWKTSSIRRWLNEDFYDGCFSSEEKSRVVLTKNFSILGSTEDRVFLLNSDQIRSYLLIPKSRSIGTPWWLRDNGSNGHIRVVDSHGNVFNSEAIATTSCAVRPAMWIRTD